MYKQYFPKYFINLLLNILLNCYIYQSVFFGKNYGDASDGTVQMVLHEHWWRWLTGKTSFLNTEFFYPFDKAFGYSDVFLLQGPIHSLFRWLGFDMFSSWSITTFVFLIVGNIGWSIFAIRILTNEILRIIFPISMVFSSSFVGYFQSEPNIVGYTWLSWFAIFLHAIYKSFFTNKRKFNILLSIFPNLIVIYALSCWYGTFFLLASLFLTLLFSALVLYANGLLREFLFKLKNRLEIKILLRGLPSFSLFLILFIYIYIPVQGDPYRPVSEMISKSPRFNYLFNGAHVNDGGLLSKIYTFLNFESQMDMQLGLGLFTASISIILIMYFLFRIRRYDNLLLLSFIISTLFLYFYFAVWDDNYSLHSYFFQNIPGLHSIRVPVRYVIFLGFVSIASIFIFIDKLLLKDKMLKNSILGLFIAILVLLDQFRFPEPGWDETIVRSEKLEAQKMEIKAKCDYFYFDAPGGWWYDQVVAMAFSYSADVPTTNGNTGAYPPNYPVQSFVHEGDISGMINWINQIDPSKVGCITNGELPIYVFDSSEDRFDVEDGFTPVETDGKNFWRWAVKSNSAFFIYSTSGTEIVIELEISNATCSKDRKIQFSTSPRNIFQELTINNEARIIRLKVPMEGSRFQKVLISTSNDPCNVVGDPRNLFYEIKNWKLL